MDGDAVRVKWSLLEADVGEPVNFELPFDEGEVWAASSAYLARRSESSFLYFAV